MINITVAGVLKNLDPGRAPGLDKISPRVLKEFMIDILAASLTTIFRKSLEEGSDWKHSNVIPIFKKARNTILPTTVQSVLPA